MSKTLHTLSKYRGRLLDKIIEGDTHVKITEGKAQGKLGLITELHKYDNNNYFTADVLFENGGSINIGGDNFEIDDKIRIDTKEDKMSKINKITEVAKILDKKLYETFGIEGRLRRYRFTRKGLEHYKPPNGWDVIGGYILQELLTGELKIKWTPEQGEKVWVIYPWLEKVTATKYLGAERDKLMVKRNMMTKTEEEAIEKMKELGWL